MDGEYTFNSEKDNNILVKYDGNRVTDIVNTFQMGSMPFKYCVIIRHFQYGYFFYQ